MKIRKDEVVAYQEHQTYLFERRRDMQKRYRILEAGLLNPGSSANTFKLLDDLVLYQGRIDHLNRACKEISNAIAEHVHPLAKRFNL